MSVQELRTLKCEVVNLIEGKGYVVRLLEDEFQGIHLAVSESTRKAYEVESALEGYRVVKSGFSIPATPVSESFILDSSALIENMEIDGTLSDDFQDDNELENLEYLMKLTADITNRYAGDYQDLAVKVANMVLSDTDTDGNIKGFQGQEDMTPSEIAKWTLLSVLKDVYMITPEVIVDLHDKFICALESGHVVVDSTDDKIIKFLPYKTSEEIDLIPILNKETVDVIFENPGPDYQTDDEVADYAIRICMDFVMKVDQLNADFEVDVVNYKDYQYYDQFLKLHGATLVDIDIGEFEKYLKQAQVTETHLEFWTDKNVDTEGILESETSQLAIQEFALRTDLAGHTCIKISFTPDAPMNEALNILRATYSAITNS